MIVSTCVNNNSEKFRNFFVDHKGKKELVVIATSFSGEYFAKKFSELLEENIKVPEFAQKYKTKFSTTNRIISTVNNITLMNTLKEYFSFTMILECGIPSIVLDGTQNDWIELKNMYEYFKSVLLETELKPWFKHFDVVINFFMEMRSMQEIGSINGTDTMKEMMKRIISYVPKGQAEIKFLVAGLDYYVLITDIIR